MLVQLRCFTLLWQTGLSTTHSAYLLSCLLQQSRDHGSPCEYSTSISVSWRCLRSALGLYVTGLKILESANFLSLSLDRLPTGHQPRTTSIITQSAAMTANQLAATLKGVKVSYKRSKPSSRSSSTPPSERLTLTSLSYECQAQIYRKSFLHRMWKVH